MFCLFVLVFSPFCQARITCRAISELFFFFFKVILLHGTYTVFFPCYPVIHGAALTQKEY